MNCYSKTIKIIELKIYLSSIRAESMNHHGTLVYYHVTHILHSILQSSFKTM